MTRQPHQQRKANLCNIAYVTPIHLKGMDRARWIQSCVPPGYCAERVCVDNGVMKKAYIIRHPNGFLVQCVDGEPATPATSVGMVHWESFAIAEIPARYQYMCGCC